MPLNYLFSPSNDKQFYLSSKGCWHQTLGRLTTSWKPERAALYSWFHITFPWMLRTSFRTSLWSSKVHNEFTSPYVNKASNWLIFVKGPTRGFVYIRACEFQYQLLNFTTKFGTKFATFAEKLYEINCNNMRWCRKPAKKSFHINQTLLYSFTHLKSHCFSLEYECWQMRCSACSLWFHVRKPDFIACKTLTCWSPAPIEKRLIRNSVLVSGN
jgi:hypothetical protein